MQYSTVNNQKTLPFSKGKGICDICGSDTLAKCGEKVMWHWAHKSKMECDPWWENETEWHRNWKEKFPENFREIVHKCETSGEKHRADIKSDRGIILEIQNSPISLEELRSRENFYKNMLWVVNGTNFLTRFKVFNTRLPNPNSKEFDDIVFAASSLNCTAFWKKSENPDAAAGKENSMVLLHPIRKIQREMDNHYIGHHPFNWKRPHVAWLKAKCPVFIDFGADILWRIENYRNQFRCVRAIAKQKVILDIINEPNAQDIASKYSVLVDEEKKVG
jgi:competence protein CoiA